MRHERGAILVVVLAALAMMAILASTLARSAYLRMLAANDFRRAEEGAREERDARGGNRPDDRATIGDGAAGASSNEGHHGSQTFPPGGDDRLGRGIDRPGHR